MDVGEDRISKLPDSLVHHILSFLPTKTVVSTSILSRRWKNVWVFIPVLDFRNWQPPRLKSTRYEDYDEEAIILETNKFMDFVDRALVLRSMLNINKFCLDCENGFFDHKRVNAWITTVMKCQVEELILSVSFSYPNNGKMIPDSLFTCESLSTLDFQFPGLDHFYLPESISLPGLKILRFTNVGFDDEKLAGKLFSSCPVLEELCLTDCSWENFYFICVSAPRLKSFTLVGCYCSNMEDIKVRIDAPNLMSFTFCDKLPEDFVVDSFPLMHDADLYYNYGDIESRFSPLSKFIMKLCNVKLLKISGAYFKILKLAKVLSTSFPTFHNLIRLEVYDIRYLQMKTLLNFLEFSPNLESLIINQVEFSGKAKENTLTFGKVPECLVCLKSFKIRKFNGYPKELEMVKFVLKHARVLQMVIMETSYTVEDYMGVHNKKKNLKAKEVEALNEKIRRQLGMSPWASTGCVIQFSSS
ncbi:hypothetical protein MKW92_026802 [Papaver armeniacum]|nr:hypothetical protein MKW92_026802 [Papaver armeniacum]